MFQSEDTKCFLAIYLYKKGTTYNVSCPLMYDQDSFLGLPRRCCPPPPWRLPGFLFPPFPPPSLRGRPRPRRIFPYFSSSYNGVSPNFGSIGIL